MLFQFEAMDPQGQTIKDVIEANDKDTANATIRSMGYFVTKISEYKIENIRAENAKSPLRFLITFAAFSILIALAIIGLVDAISWINGLE